MNKLLSSTVLFIFALMTACEQRATKTLQNTPQAQQSIAIDYPVTQKVDVVDTYFGEEVVDAYRWLEDDRSEATAKWVEAQNKVTHDYLATIPYREKITKTLSSVMNYERVGTPFTEGHYVYIYKNDGLQNQSVLYRRKVDTGDDAELEVFLDPNTFSEDGTTSMSGVSFSEDGSKVAYQTSKGGSDWREIVVLDVETK